MSSFKEQLEARKAEILREKMQELNPPVEAPAEPSTHPPFHDMTEKLLLGVAAVLVLVYLMVSTVVMSDWWGFVGTPEYHQWKERVEKIK